MVAQHGREDPLLEPGRFSRLLRQANDAEIADVRKVGEDDYEVSPHRSSGVTSAPAVPATPPATAAPTDEFATVTTETPAAEAGRSDNGQRLGLRFRRGSRGTLRPGEIPLIGVVQMDAPTEPVVATLEPIALEEEPVAAPRKPARPRARKKAAAAPATTPAPSKASDGEGAAPAPRAKRTRARPKKKAE
jgi:hypothetical protein